MEHARDLETRAEQDRRLTERRHDDRRHTLSLGGRRHLEERRRHDRRMRLAGAGLLATLAFAVGGQQVLSRMGVPAVATIPPAAGQPSASVDVDTNFRLPSWDRASLEPIIQEAATLHNLPADLIRAVIQTESHFNPMAVSRVGAQGLMQLMPETARHVGIDNPFDPRENILGGTKYLSMLLERFKGNTARALAAYNAGPNAVTRHGGVPPYRETQGYVRKIQKLVDNTDAEFSFPVHVQKASLGSRRSHQATTSRKGAGRGRPALRKASATRRPVVKRTGVARRSSTHARTSRA